MRKSEARALVALLAAAFPRDWVGELTEEVYVERLVRLSSFEAAQEAVYLVIDSSPRLPSIAAIRETYGRAVERHQPAELDEPELTEEQREENVLRMRALVDDLSERMKRPPAEPSFEGPTMNAQCEDGPARGTGLTLDGEPKTLHLDLPDPRQSRDTPREERKRRAAVYDRTDKTVAGVTLYRFRLWKPDDEEERP